MGREGDDIETRQSLEIWGTVSNCGRNMVDRSTPQKHC